MLAYFEAQFDVLYGVGDLLGGAEFFESLKMGSRLQSVQYLEVLSRRLPEAEGPVLMARDDEFLMSRGTLPADSSRYRPGLDIPCI